MLFRSDKIGEMPLPEYVKREPTEHDKETYQCVFANPTQMASIAPPTGGLHFTNDIIKKLEDKGVRYGKIVAGKIIFCEGFGALKNPFLPTKANGPPLQEAHLRKQHCLYPLVAKTGRCTAFQLQRMNCESIWKNKK